MPARGLIAVVALLSVLAGCGSTSGTSADDVSGDELAARAEGRTLIDVRTPEETAEGHLEGALLLDLQDPGFPTAVAALPRDEPYLVYCRTGARAAEAIAVMEELGFSDVVNGGGYADLAAAGLPTA